MDIFKVVRQYLLGDVLAFNAQNLYPILEIRRMAVSTPKLLKDPEMMSHDEFVLGYENGRVGCSVSTLLILRLFFAGRIREKKVSIILLLWTFGFLVLIALSVIGFFIFPVLWALLGTLAILAICALTFFYWVGEVIVAAALANEEFFELAKTKLDLFRRRKESTQTSESCTYSARSSSSTLRALDDISACPTKKMAAVV